MPRAEYLVTTELDITCREMSLSSFFTATFILLYEFDGKILYMGLGDSTIITENTYYY